jgi:hypothetical protein
VTAVRYGYGHRQIRKLGLPYAYGTPCVRCGELMLPGQLLHLNHADDGIGYLGFSHAACNTRAGAIKSNKNRAPRPLTPRQIRAISRKAVVKQLRTW